MKGREGGKKGRRRDTTNDVDTDDVDATAEDDRVNDDENGDDEDALLSVCKFERSGL